MLAAVTPFLFFVAFFLLFFVSLSVPIIKTISLFTLSANVGSSLFDSGVNGSVRFGVWGYCISAIDVSVAGIDHSTAAQCSKAKLGFHFDSTIATALHVDGLENAISHTITAALVLHPIVCALSFIAFLASHSMIRRNGGALSRPAYLFTIGISLLAALLTTISFLIDVTVVGVVKHAVNGESLKVNWGDAVWMTLGSAIALWVALVSTCGGVCGLCRRTKNVDRY